ncbi:MAG: peptidylprolyl isomerase [Sulfuricellaceae bacterium]
MKQKLHTILFILALFAGFDAQAANPLVKVSTNYGEMVFELYPDKAPLTVANFLNYVNSGHYDGTVFHRVIDKFMLQGGGYTADLEHKPTQPPIPNEADNGLKNEPGTLAMAHNAAPDSATSQFYINLADNKYLNHHAPQPKYFGYCVFGKVVKGWDVAKKIAAQPTGAAGRFPSNVPVQPVVIEQATLVSAEEMSAFATQPKKPLKKS